MSKSKKNVALLVIDMQTEFFEKEDTQTSMKQSLEYINYDAKDCGKNAIVCEAIYNRERKENFNLEYNVNGGSI